MASTNALLRPLNREGPVAGPRRQPGPGDGADGIEWDRGHTWATGSPRRTSPARKLAAARPIETRVAARTVAHATSSMFILEFLE